MGRWDWKSQEGGVRGVVLLLACCQLSEAAEEALVE